MAKTTKPKHLPTAIQNLADEYNRTKQNINAGTNKLKEDLIKNATAPTRLTAVGDVGFNKRHNIFMIKHPVDGSWLGDMYYQGGEFKFDTARMDDAAKELLRALNAQHHFDLSKPNDLEVKVRNAKAHVEQVYANAPHKQYVLDGIDVLAVFLAS